MIIPLISFFLLSFFFYDYSVDLDSEDGIATLLPVASIKAGIRNLRDL